MTKNQQSIERRLRSLEGRHRELDRIIEHNEQSSNPESWQSIQSLKKQKLQLKDEINSLRSSLSQL